MRLANLSIVVLVVLLLSAAALADLSGFNKYSFTVVDETGRLVTSSLTAAAYSPGTSTAVTVYLNNAKTAIGSALTAQTDGTFEFWSDVPSLDIKLTNNVNKRAVIVPSVTPQRNRLTFPASMATIQVIGNNTFSAIKTVRYTISWPGGSGADFKFTADANTTEQVIDLGAIIPARARVLDATVINTSAFVIPGATKTLVAEVGTTSSGNELASSATIYASGATVSTAAGSASIGAVATTAGNVYVSVTPGENWSTITAGQVTVLVTYLDLDALK